MSRDVEIVAAATIGPERARAFFESLAEVDRTFIDAEVFRPGVIDSLLAGKGAERHFLAVLDGDVVGYLGVLPGTAWSSHVAVIRIVVRPDRRRRGIATQLARHAVVSAARGGIKKLVVEVVSDQQATVAMFTGLGFEAEGLLREHVVGGAGQTHDLLVLSHFVDELYETMTTTGVEEAVTE